MGALELMNLVLHESFGAALFHSALKVLRKILNSINDRILNHHLARETFERYTYRYLKLQSKPCPSIEQVLTQVYASLNRDQDSDVVRPQADACSTCQAGRSLAYASSTSPDLQSFALKNLQPCRFQAFHCAKQKWAATILQYYSEPCRELVERLLDHGMLASVYHS
jgi:hypothetical protein